MGFCFLCVESSCLCLCVWWCLCESVCLTLSVFHPGPRQSNPSSENNPLLFECITQSGGRLVPISSPSVGISEHYVCQLHSPDDDSWTWSRRVDPVQSCGPPASLISLHNQIQAPWILSFTSVKQHIRYCFLLDVVYVCSLRCVLSGADRMGSSGNRLLGYFERV
jgi:hypothetical protein